MTERGDSLIESPILPPTEFLTYADFRESVQDYELSAKKDQHFIYRTHCSITKAGRITTRFSGASGKKYTFRLLSRKLDSLSKIDLVPESAFADKKIPSTRISDVLLTKKDNYFVTTFNFSLAKDTRWVDIIFDGVKYSGMKETDFVLFVFEQD